MLALGAYDTTHESVDVLRAGVERVERHVVQDAVRNDDEPASLEAGPDRREQFVEQLVQVCLR